MPYILHSLHYTMRRKGNNIEVKSVLYNHSSTYSHKWS